MGRRLSWSRMVVGGYLSAAVSVWSRRWVAEAVRVGVGVLLLVAAGLKGWELAAGGPLGSGLLASRWVLWGVVGCEVALGLWLLAGIYRQGAWWASLGCFAVFLAVALSKAISNEPSCGCFGRLAVNPWLTVGLDLSVVAGLWGWAVAVGRRAEVIARLFLVVAAVSVATAALWAIWPEGNQPFEHGVERPRELSRQVADCPQQCAQFASRWARAQLGLEISGDGVTAAASPSAVLANLLYDAIPVRGMIEVVPVGRLVEHGAEQPPPSAILVHRTGHVYVVAGKILVEGRPWYHVLHGESGAALLSATQLGHFAEAWRIVGDGRGPAVRVGSTVLRLDKGYHHFGEVPAEADLECSFTVANEGPETVVVDTPHSSCACTVVAPGERTELKPGGQFTLVVKFRSGSGAAQRHKVYLSFIEKSSGGRSRIALDVLASQRVGMRVSETRLDFGRVVAGKDYARTLRLEEVPTDRFEVQAVDVGGLPLEYAVQRTTGENGLAVYRVQLRLRASQATTGVQRGLLQLTTTSQVRPRIPIPVQYEVLAPVRAVPGVLALGNVPLGTPQRRRVELEGDGEPLSVSLEKAPPQCSVELPPSGTGPTVWVTTQLDRMGIWQGEVVLRVRLGQQEHRVVVPCVAYGMPR